MNRLTDNDFRAARAAMVALGLDETHDTASDVCQRLAQAIADVRVNLSNPAPKANTSSSYRVQHTRNGKGEDVFYIQKKGDGKYAETWSTLHRVLKPDPYDQDPGPHRNGTMADALAELKTLQEDEFVTVCYITDPNYKLMLPKAQKIISD